MTRKVGLNYKREILIIKIGGLMSFFRKFSILVGLIVTLSDLSISSSNGADAPQYFGFYDLQNRINLSDVIQVIITVYAFNRVPEVISEVAMTMDDFLVSGKLGDHTLNAAALMVGGETIIQGSLTLSASEYLQWKKGS